jgi:UDP-N-acetylglucosamine/UDP-N-acetylgalactosamine diphosphorylase
VEVSQHDQFAPVKNASGAASDTPESSRAAIVARAKRWLTSVGVEVVDGVQVEIHPSFALDVDELAKRVTTDKITADMFLS